jgi:hypothetical protein
MSTSDISTSLQAKDAAFTHLGKGQFLCVTETVGYDCNIMNWKRKSSSVPKERTIYETSGNINKEKIKVGL